MCKTLTSSLVKHSSAIVIFAAGMQLKAPLESREAAAIAIIFKPFPRIETAQINVAEHHATEMREVRDASLTRRNRRIKRDRADDPDKVFHLDWKEKIEVHNPVRINQTVCEQDTVNSRRRTDARSHLIGHEQRIENTAADHCDEIITQEKTAAPTPLEIAAEHPHGEHVE